MRFGVLNLFCPMCGLKFRYDQGKPSGVCHHSEFGLLCSKICLDTAELKYARMILGKSDEEVASAL
jgi:hypothetical protein